LADPVLELHRADTTLLAVNDNWRESASAAEIEAVLPPGNDLESAIPTTLAAKPGSDGGAGYTGVLAGKDGITGIGLLEIYDLAQAGELQAGEHQHARLCWDRRRSANRRVYTWSSRPLEHQGINSSAGTIAQCGERAERAAGSVA
jgi:hypothetical protein